MDENLDQYISIHSSDHAQSLSPESNKKRKLQLDLNDSCSPVSKQRIHNPQLMEQEEEEDSSENNTVSSFFKSEKSNSSMNQDWPCTSSSSYGSNEINSTLVDSADNFQFNMASHCKKGVYSELQVFEDPIMAELIMKNEPDGSDEDQLDPFLYSNGLNGFSLLPVLQGSKGAPREQTIDKEFEEYFSGLML